MPAWSGQTLLNGRKRFDGVRNFVVMEIPQGYGKCKSDNDRHQSNYPRVFPRDITTGDGAQAETQPHIFEELPGPCGSIRQEHGGPPCLERCGTSGNHAERRRASRQGLRQVWLYAGESRRLCKGHDAQAHDL